MGTIFKKIIDREIPAKIVAEDAFCLAFHDVNPQAPVHVLVIPKTTEIDRLSQALDSHRDVLGRLMLFARDVARTLNLDDYRIVINNGAAAGQTVFHLHLHILSGRPLAWPPG